MQTFLILSIVHMQLSIDMEVAKVVSGEPAEVSWMRLKSGQGILTNLLFTG